MPPRFKYLSEKIRLIHRIGKEERGSALVMVLFIVLIFTILGTAVLSASIGGATRTTTRENDVQSLHLTEKSLDEAAAYITSELNDLKDIDPEKLEAIIKKYIDSTLDLANNEIKVNTDLTAAKGKIKNIKYDRMVSNLDKQTINYYITITAEAMVNGVKREMKRELIIDTYPDFLKYALGSGGAVINENTGKKGNLIINGAAAVEGNIYAGNDLILRDRAKYFYGSENEKIEETLFPLLKGGKGYGQAHVQSLEQVLFFDRSNMSDKSVKTETQLDNTFKEILGINNMDDVVIRNKDKFVEINVEESFMDKVVEAAGVPVNDRDALKKSFSGNVTSLIDWIGKEIPYVSAFEQIEKLPDKPIKPLEPLYLEEDTDVARESNKELLANYNEAFRIYENDLANYNAELKKLEGRDKSAIYNSDLLIDNLEYKKLTYTGDKASKWFIVKGNLTIDNIEEEELSALSIRGNVLVTGNVTIRGNVSFDSTMFVLGETTVEDAVISGLYGKELVLMSKGKILITRYNKFSDVPLDFKGFFYTDKSAELYGVGSKFRLHGGFFAKGELTVNAVLGHVEGSQPNLTFMEDRDRTKPRFEVIYDPKVYIDQKAGLPRVQQVNVRVGPIQLMPNTGN